MDIPATGKSLSAEVVRIDRFEGDKIAETRAVFDRAAAMEQIGGPERPRSAKKSTTSPSTQTTHHPLSVVPGDRCCSR